MKIPKGSCDCCGINNATIKDYREFTNQGDLESYWVCFRCLHIEDSRFYRLMRSKGKLSIMRQLIEEDPEFVDENGRWDVVGQWMYEELSQSSGHA